MDPPLGKNGPPWPATLLGQRPEVKTRKLCAVKTDPKTQQPREPGARKAKRETIPKSRDGSARRISIRLLVRIYALETVLHMAVSFSSRRSHAPFPYTFDHPPLAPHTPACPLVSFPTASPPIRFGRLSLVVILNCARMLFRKSLYAHFYVQYLV